ncbi:MAG: FAD-binding oxidoreductase [Planctomycetaceae bacterium]|nr:FAD-binding oxidoreductase [Planctomycetaceae bacterium]
MASPSDLLPIKKTFSPADQGELAGVVREAFETGTPLYPIGGGTSLDFGLPAKAPGNGLSLAKINRVIDYPARDMTVTVEAGLTMQALADLLATERQRLPIDVPRPGEATIGGVIATNWNGPRRYGQGSVRDHVIGIHAVDGRGMPFKGGGRVVKNVAGYDFCKLLTGSLGTLGVITQVTFKLKPIPEQSVLVGCNLPDLDTAEKVLASLVRSEATPAAIELVAGPAWAQEPALQSLADSRNATEGVPYSASVFVVVGLEGTQTEVEYMIHQLTTEWRALDAPPPQAIGESTTLWKSLAEFPAAGQSPLALKAAVVPSGVTAMISAARQLDPQCSIQAHAGNGTVLIKLAAFPAQGLSRALVGQLQPVATAHSGNLVVLSNPSGAEMTHQSVWGAIDAPLDVMSVVKRKFDPQDILNRGRFVYV